MLMLPPVEEEPGLNDYPVLYWNHAGLEMNRITHSLGGPQTGPTMSSRALGLLHLAMHDAYFGALGEPDVYLDLTPQMLSEFPDCRRDVAWTLADANHALTAAAITVLNQLYSKGGAGISMAANYTLTTSLSKLIADYPNNVDSRAAQYRFGECIADLILDRLAVKDGEPGADQGSYQTKDDRFYFRDEPVNPVKRILLDPDRPERGSTSKHIYHGPFYGTTVKTFAVRNEGALVLANPPKGGPDYLKALREVVKSGGAPNLPGTLRTPDQTTAAYYWAYDGANLIGTPPRLYNQIMRKIAWEKRVFPAPNPTDLQLREQTSDFVRLFALINVAMADAGKFAWKEKYRFEYWRPLSGVREHDSQSGPSPKTGNEHLDADADPFWLALGAPETNTNNISFKPPFPAYPSGHATFGAACFQMARLFLNRKDAAFKRDGKDNISFSFVSEELNGISRDLHVPYDAFSPITDQPGTVRTRVVRRFKSLWQAIYENAVSRVYLGVHWHFDAFDPKDTIKTVHPEGTIDYKDTDDIEYKGNVGGVWLGLTIANDIWDNDMKAPSAVASLAPASIGRELNLKSSNTNIR